LESEAVLNFQQRGHHFFSDFFCFSETSGGSGLGGSNVLALA
jgi:hypothetical protein